MYIFCKGFSASRFFRAYAFSVSKRTVKLVFRRAFLVYSGVPFRAQDSSVFFKGFVTTLLLRKLRLHTLFSKARPIILAAYLRGKIRERIRGRERCFTRPKKPLDVALKIQENRQIYAIILTRVWRGSRSIRALILRRTNSARRRRDDIDKAPVIMPNNFRLITP